MPPMRERGAIWSLATKRLENRIRALEVANPDVCPTQAASASGSRAIKPARVSANAASTFKPKPDGKCPLCKENHLLSYCAKYKGMTVANRGELAKKFNLCLSCLRTGHRVNACAATGRCLVCSGKHHTSLHGFTFQHVANLESSEGGDIGTVTSSTATTSVAALATPTAPTVLLKTAMVTLLSDSGHAIKVRALLDSGAQSTFVTEWVAQQLHASRRRVNVTVLGLQEAHMGVVSSSCRLTVSSPHKPSLRLPTEALVLRSLISLLPPERVRTTSWPHLSGLELADPAYDVPAPVGAVLGSDVYDLVMEPALRHGPPGSPSAQLTAFGWVLSGLASVDRGMTTAHYISVNFARTNEDLSRAVQRLWELEEVSSQSPLTPDEIWAEQQFRETHSRNPDGRYIVRLPRRREEEVKLGNSRRAAMTILLNSERRLGTKAELRKRYADFMVEYLALGHMDLVSPEALTARESYYLPHHAVFKAGDSSNKIRVVFNGSFRTTSGFSLNDALLPGPRLQSDLWTVLTR
ncbi:uncharacterized protein LOC113005229 [Solenopsis invicta]|uniref:uncharacterized protein LOC113005229 n=1 Tax=Solenopsis invicta TaxID=13686 RepID=UPI00193DEE60|nr:uncharacterized protein LOC113005229 [Solenopsis invicta]